jgi:hypothetical protein
MSNLQRRNIKVNTRLSDPNASNESKSRGPRTKIFTERIDRAEEIVSIFFIRHRS